ncbi:Protein CBG02838 [Caenorhabditis briggsae]|uniref:Protein CBG02838 n=1 Tax=Caenorhabditis briggsae TaxID=6238 RepID=A8WTE6_CAEBR|nr:Protein CBG02838 [Caenorhabditis briggsae]CAP23757.1 Protein CBG02838 [Caenorhabditis briggsae]
MGGCEELKLLENEETKDEAFSESADIILPLTTKEGMEDGDLRRRLTSEKTEVRNFLGRNIRLQGVTLTNQDLLQLLDKWISNEAYHNLETLTIYVDAPNTLINEDLIRQTIAFEEYDTNMPEKRPDRFIFDVPITPKKYSLRDPEF